MKREKVLVLTNVIKEQIKLNNEQIVPNLKTEMRFVDGMNLLGELFVISFRNFALLVKNRQDTSCLKSRKNTILW